MTKKYVIHDGRMCIIDAVHADPIRPRVFLMTITGDPDGFWLDQRDVTPLSATEAVRWMTDGMKKEASA